MPTIEVAHLSLAAIVERFPEELKPLLLGEPDPNATVALPMPTILKQLPSGSVKMSLASLHRQAHGLLAPLPPGDKRSVDVPLAEVFRHLRPEALRRRADQRPVAVPESGFNLFSDASNPYAIAPDADAVQAEAEPEPIDIPEEEPEAPAAPAPGLKPPPAMRAPFANGTTEDHPSETMPRAITPPPGFAPPSGVRTPIPAKAAPVPAAPASRATPPRSGINKAAAAAAGPVAKPTGETITVAVSSISAGWPEEIVAELGALDPATKVTLPSAELSAGLAKGKVTFLWKQIHAWLEPAASGTSAVAGETALSLPLKVIAPLFLKSQKPSAERKAFRLDESIPSLFTDGRPPPPPKPVAPPEPEPAPEPEAIAPAPEMVSAPAVEAEAPAPAPAAEVETPAAEAPAVETPAVETPVPAPAVIPAPEIAPAAEVAPAVEAAPVVPAPEVAPVVEAAAEPVLRIAPEPTPAAPAPEPVPEPAPAEVAAPVAAPAPAAEVTPAPAPAPAVAAEVAPVATPAAPVAAEPEPAPVAQTVKFSETVGELFGQPNKKHWTPADLVKGIVTLPGVAGAIVALQEGLPVTAVLPEGVKSDVVAAFLPQIFARLNQYAGEMKLGDVDDLLFTTHGAHCQIYRLGYIYFAVLGKAGEALPWHELHLVTEELARQTHK